VSYAPALSLALTLGPTGLWWTHLLVMVGVYALLGLSLNLINGYGRMFSLGHHGFWALGAYAAAVATRAFEGDIPGGLLVAVSALVGMAVAAVGGLAIGIPCLRLRGDYLAVATLGFAEIVRITIQNLPEELLGGNIGMRVPRVLMEVGPDTRGTFFVTWTLLLVAGVILVALLVRNLVRSARGRLLLAVAQDETAAGLLGINPTRTKVTAFVLGSALAGLAGALYAHYQGTISPQEFTFLEMVKMLLVVVLGGLGSISGCILAAFLLLYVEQVLQLAGQDPLPGGVIPLPASWTWLGTWWNVVYALILVLLMIFRPHGLFGPRELPEVVRSWFRRGRTRPGGAAA
jgi:branched-chain amino acid transport system permease protein